MPQNDWFEHYLKRFDTVEINASFYSWPTVASVQAWRRQPGRKKFVYTVKVCELITHIKKFKGTKTLVKDFGMIADILGDRMGCFSSSYRRAIGTADPARWDRRPTGSSAPQRHRIPARQLVERGGYGAFRKAGIIFCSCSGPRFPDELIRTADEVYVGCMGPALVSA